MVGEDTNHGKLPVLVSPPAPYSLNLIALASLPAGEKSPPRTANCIFIVELRLIALQGTFEERGLYTFASITKFDEVYLLTFVK